MLENLEQLIKKVRERKSSPLENSYTNKLLNDKNLSVAKVKEEIGELIESVKQNSNKIHEASDVISNVVQDAVANLIKEAPKELTGECNVWKNYVDFPVGKI